jgi:hypothetical protein
MSFSAGFDGFEALPAPLAWKVGLRGVLLAIKLDGMSSCAVGAVHAVRPSEEEHAVEVQLFLNGGVRWVRLSPSKYLKFQWMKVSTSPSRAIARAHAPATGRTV